MGGGGGVRRGQEGGICYCTVFLVVSVWEVRPDLVTVFHALIFSRFLLLLVVVVASFIYIFGRDGL